MPHHTSLSGATLRAPLFWPMWFEIVGFVARTLGKSSPMALGLYTIQSVFILLAPILFAASVYMFLGRIFRAIGATEYSVVRVNWLTKIFVAGDFLCFQVQGAGGGVLASAKSEGSNAVGKAIILTGLILQMIIFGLFLVVPVVCHRRMNKDFSVGGTHSFNWRKYLLMLYIVSILITVRNFFRAIEYAMGDGYLLVDEWPIYIFDALLMVIFMVICATWYVGDLTPNSIQAESDEFEMLSESR